MIAKEEWLNWRCEKMRDLYERMAEIIHAKRPDMKLVINLSNAEAVSARKKRKDKQTYRLSLKSFQLRSFSLPEGAEIISVNTEVSMKEVMRLQEIEKEIEAIMAEASLMKGSPVFKLALDTFNAGKSALAGKCYFEAQRLFENYRLARAAEVEDEKDYC